MSALLSLLIPGLGQVAQRRVLTGFCWFAASAVAWIATLGTLGWVVNVLAAFDAALYHPKEKP